MREIVIQIPVSDTEHNVEIDVRINGKKRTLRYRVELIDCEESQVPVSNRADVIKQYIDNHDENWEVIQIGIPRKDSIAVTFRQRSETAM